MRTRFPFAAVPRRRAHGLWALIAAFAVTVSIVEAVPAQAAPAAPPTAYEGASDDPVPVPDGEPAPPSDPGPGALADDPTFWNTGRQADLSDPLPDDELNAALDRAAATGQPVEIASRTTETTISYAQPDGTVQLQSAVAPVRTRVDGQWVPVDTTLELTPDGVQPVAVTGDITFSAGGEQPMAVLGNGEGTSISLDWSTPLPAPELAGDTATYRNVLPNVDLLLTATRQGFEQHLIVNARPDAATLRELQRLEFPLASDGATVTDGDADQLTVVEDGSGEVVGGAAAPLMWDARIDPQTDEPVSVRSIGLDLAPASEPGTDATLVLTPPSSFLTSAATVYPVTIDPTQTLGAIGDTFIQTGIANSPQGGSGELRTGSYNGGGDVALSLLRFDVSALKNRIVQSSTLSLWEFHSFSCSPRWVDVRESGDFDPNTVTWNSQPWIGGIVANANVAYGYSSACPANVVNFDMTGWAQYVADSRNQYPNIMALALTTSTGTDSAEWKKFNSGNAPNGVPIMTFTYDGGCDQYAGNTVCGLIRDKYYSIGGANSYLGLPTTSEICGLVNGGCYSGFQGGAIYFSPASGAHIVRGSIFNRWGETKWETGYLGYPTNDETCGLRDGGCYSLFQNGAIYWSPATGAHDIAGAIGNAWAGQNWEVGWLGYPVSNTQWLAGGARNDFEGGNIVYDQRTSATVLGAGTLANPTQFQRITQARTQLKATAPVRSSFGVDYNAVRFQWRPYALDPTSGWTDVAASTLRMPDQSAVTTGDGWLPLTAGTAQNGSVANAATKNSVIYTWNATATVPVDGLVQVRGCFRGTDANATLRCSAVTQVTVDRAGLTGANATADAGPGTVGLLTGAYLVTGRDADVSAPFGGLAATRTFTSNAAGQAGPLGPGWRLSLAVDEAGADYASLTDRVDSLVITRGDGTQSTFVRKSSTNADLNNYVGEGEAAGEGATVTFNPGTAGTAPATYVLTDLDGDKVTFRRADGAAGHTDQALFRVDKIEAIRGSSATATTSIVYTAAGNPQWLLAPTDAGTVCAVPAPTIAAGCRALEFSYTGSSSTERLTAIRLWANGAAAPAGGLVTGDTPVTAQTIVLASYGYNGSGQLTSVTDPRSGLTVGYGYNASGRLSMITPAGGTATWTLGYDTAPLPRLITATLDDTPDTGLAALTASIRYDVPRDGSNGLPDLRTAAIDHWGQPVGATPTDMTAVFGPTTVPDATPTAAQWPGATLYALDVNGRTVNTAGYGGTANQDTGATQSATWRITTTQYDDQGRGNVVRTLTAGNRERALAFSTDAAAQKTQALLLDTVNIYSADGVDLLRTYTPARSVVPAGGGAPLTARGRTVTDYDTGTEAGHPAGGVRHLPVRTTVDAVQITTSLPAGSTGTDPALPALDGRQRITLLEYGDANAWRFGTPTATRVQMGAGAEIVTRQTVDDQGRTTSSTLPAGGTSTTTAATTQTVYYAATNTDPACVNAAWAGWICKTLPGGTPSAGFTVPTSWVKSYDIYGHRTRTLETGQGVTRTTDTAYDAAGRTRRTATTGTGPEVGQTRPATETTSTAAGQPDQTRLINPDGTLTGDPAQGTGPISHGYDAYGRRTSYTDGSGLLTTQTYDSVGRLKAVTNTHGSRTFTYDENGERGSLPTSIAVSDVGTFTARYGADGTLVVETLPGGLTATTITDAAGDPTSLSYAKTTADGSSEWLRSSATMSGFDQVNSYRLVSANGTGRTTRYAYDNLGRLVTATDTTAADGSGASCTRSYAFDANSNRTGLTQNATAGAPAGTCPTSVPASDSYTYDTADRLQLTDTRASLRYDAFGRTRTLPSTDTADLGGDVAIDYYVDDLVAGLTQAGKTSTFGLDAAARRTLRTDTGAANPTVSYYTGDDDNPDVVKEGDNSYTRNITGFGGLDAVVTRAGTAGAVVTLQLADLHGDISATLPMTAGSASDMTVTETTEYGEPRNQPAAGNTPARYGWLGTNDL
jgi:YD repeat-containing protein